jgi:hypothetical protein
MIRLLAQIRGRDGARNRQAIKNARICIRSPHTIKPPDLDCSRMVRERPDLCLQPPFFVPNHHAIRLRDAAVLLREPSSNGRTVAGIPLESLEFPGRGLYLPFKSLKFVCVDLLDLETFGDVRKHGDGSNHSIAIALYKHNPSSEHRRSADLSPVPLRPFTGTYSSCQNQPCWFLRFQPGRCGSLALFEGALRLAAEPSINASRNR